MIRRRYHEHSREGFNLTLADEKLLVEYEQNMVICPMRAGETLYNSVLFIDTPFSGQRSLPTTLCERFRTNLI